MCRCACSFFSYSFIHFTTSSHLLPNLHIHTPSHLTIFTYIIKTTQSRGSDTAAPCSGKRGQHPELCSPTTLEFLRHMLVAMPTVDANCNAISVQSMRLFRHSDHGMASDETEGKWSIDSKTSRHGPYQSAKDAKRNGRTRLTMRKVQ